MVFGVLATKPNHASVATRTANFSSDSDGFSLSPSRNDAVENGERDRPGRCHRRPADGFCDAHTQPKGDNFTALDWSAGRRPERARRTRSPFLIESLRPRSEERGVGKVVVARCWRPHLEKNSMR